MPFFSIIIPTYNRGALIGKTIQSILSQTFVDYEIIIVDDGSTDNTEEIIKSVKSEKIILIKQKNNERGAARNAGTKKANGTYITFLDSDDVFYPNHLQIAHNTIKNNLNPEVFHTRYEIIKEDGQVIEQKKLLTKKINKNLISGNFMSCNGVFLRKDIALANLFNEDRALSALEDWELWLRIASKYSIIYSNTITSAIINHDSRSVLNTNKADLILRIETLLKYVLSNSQIISYYKHEISKFKSSCYTYIALHLALTKNNRIDAIKFLIKGLRENNSAVFTRRFYAIIKHLI